MYISVFDQRQGSSSESIKRAYFGALSCESWDNEICHNEITQQALAERGMLTTNSHLRQTCIALPLHPKSVLPPSDKVLLLHPDNGRDRREQSAQFPVGLRFLANDLHLRLGVGVSYRIYTHSGRMASYDFFFSWQISLCKLSPHPMQMRSSSCLVSS